MRRARAATALLAALAAIVPAAAALAAAPGQYSPGDEALYLRRLDERNRTRADFETYDTVAPVPGAVDPAPLPRASAADGSIEPAALATARDYAAAHASSALLVWRRGRVESAAYFGGLRPHETILSRSLAKPLAAVAVGRAIALGKIRSLDQRAADFLPEWRGDDRRGRILLRHLLGMRAGFLPQANATRPDDILNRSFLHPRHDEIIVREYPVVDEPGTRFEYNNASFDVLAVILQRATGMRYEDFVGRELLAPIGARGGEIWVSRPGGTAHAGCCIMIPAESWLRVGVLLAQDGRWDGRRLLPAGFVREMSTGTPDMPWYGLGVYVAGPYTERRGWASPGRTPRELQVLHSEPYLAADLFLFDGNGNQVMYVVPSEQLVILRTGRSPPRGGPAGEWDNSALPNAIVRGIRRAPGDRVPPPQRRP